MSVIDGVLGWYDDNDRWQTIELHKAIIAVHLVEDHDMTVAQVAESLGLTHVEVEQSVEQLGTAAR